MLITKENAEQYYGRAVVMTDGCSIACVGKLVDLQKNAHTPAGPAVCIPLRFPYSLRQVDALGCKVLSIDASPGDV